MPARRFSTTFCLVAASASPALAEVGVVTAASLEAPASSTAPAPSAAPTPPGPSAPAGDLQPAPADELPVAVAVNAPFRWADAGSIAASVYVGLTREHAIRANAASYAYGPNLLGEVLVLAAGGDGSEGSYSGRTTDLGLGLVHYPRRLWSGFTYEVGVLHRARDVRVEDDFAPSDVVMTDTSTYAGRILLGWSWLMYERVFVAFGVGLSLGYEHGTESTETWDGEMKMTTEVSRPDLGGEGYLRIGGAFEL